MLVIEDKEVGRLWREYDNSGINFFDPASIAVRGLIRKLVFECKQHYLQTQQSEEHVDRRIRWGQTQQSHQSVRFYDFSRFSFVRSRRVLTPLNANR
jgi:hypothetical protein